MKSKFRILLALTLTLAMAFGNVLTVAAEDEKVYETVLVHNGDMVVGPDIDPDSDGSYTLDGSIVDENAGYEAPVLGVISSSKPSVITVTGNVEAAPETPVPVTAVGVTAQGSGATAKATVEGEVVASSEKAPGLAAQVGCYGEGSTAELTIGEGAEGQVIVMSLGGGSSTLTIEDGGVTAEDPWAIQGPGTGAAVVVMNQEGTANVDITDGVTASGTGIASCTYTGGQSGPHVGDSLDGDDSDDPSAKTTIAVTGNITVTGVSENAHFPGDFGTVGVDLKVGGEGAETEFTMEEGELTVTGEEDGYAYGLDIENEKATLTATLTDVDITATGENSIGINIVARSEYRYTAEDENISWDEPYQYTCDDEEFDLVYYDSVDVGDKSYSVYGKTVDGETQYFVAEYKDGKYYYYPVADMKPEVEQESTTAVTVEGDVTADNFGVAVSATPGAKTDVVIDGTVQGKEGSLVLVNNTELGNGVTLTVWEVKPNEQGALVSSIAYGPELRPWDPENPGGPEIGWASGDDEEEKPELVQNKAAEAQLQYIIRVKDDSKDYIATNGTQEYSANGKTYNVAHEGETVTLKLNIPEGYEVAEAYSDQAQSMKLEKNA